ncbi:GP88 family protein [Paludisphaera soli]|uniref:GP88 family protein n=1 Tax=Paludisphaera soli TaxID=2712865 RepID=UPI0013EBADBF
MQPTRQNAPGRSPGRRPATGPGRHPGAVPCRIASNSSRPPPARVPSCCRGNTKLGRELIWSYSTPAITSCRGSTPACRASCYACSCRFAFPPVKGGHARNLDRAQGPGFVADLVDQVRPDFVRVVRVHGSGDFHSAGYVGLWAEAARPCPRPCSTPTRGPGGSRRSAGCWRTSPACPTCGSGTPATATPAPRPATLASGRPG